MTFKTRKLAAGTAIACLTLLSVVTGCKKSNSNSNAIGASANVGAAAFATPIITGAHNLGPSWRINFFQVIAIQVKGNDSTAIQVAIMDTVKVNQTVATDGDNNIYYYPVYNVWGSEFDADPMGGGHGTITITAKDTTAKTIAGTFHGVLYNNNSPVTADSIIVSNGRFNTTYQ